MRRPHSEGRRKIAAQSRQPIVRGDSDRDELPAANRAQLRRLGNPLVIVCLLAALDTWALRWDANTDAASYFAIAEQLGKGHLADAVNAYWSPLYSVLLAPPFALVFPGPWVLPWAHAVNFAAFVGAAFAVRFLVSSIVDEPERRRRADAVALTGLLVVTLLFAPTSLITPDVVAIALVSLLTALAVRTVRAEKPSAWYLGSIGAVGGLLYLDRAASVPLIVGLAGMLVIIIGKNRAHALALVALGFAITGGVWMTVLSVSSGTLTMSSAPRLNYAWGVNGVDRVDFWLGRTPAFGLPVHPPDRLRPDGGILGFPKQEPPFSSNFESDYWNAGLESRTSVRATVSRAGRIYPPSTVLGVRAILPFLLTLLVACIFCVRRSRPRRLALLVFLPLAAQAAPALISSPVARYGAPILVCALASAAGLGTFDFASRTPRALSWRYLTLAGATLLVTFVVGRVAVDVGTAGFRLVTGSAPSQDAALIRYLKAHPSPGGGIGIVGREPERPALYAMRRPILGYIVPSRAQPAVPVRLTPSDLRSMCSYGIGLVLAPSALVTKTEGWGEIDDSPFSAKAACPT